MNRVFGASISVRCKVRGFTSAPFRVVTLSFIHETNTFCSRIAGEHEFRMVTGQNLQAAMAPRGIMREANSGIGGFTDCARKFGWELCYTSYAEANPSGKVANAVYDACEESIISAIESQV